MILKLSGMEQDQRTTSPSQWARCIMSQCVVVKAQMQAAQRSAIDRECRILKHNNSPKTSLLIDYSLTVLLYTHIVPTSV